MHALISAELLRLRTVRSPRYGAFGILAFVALTAALNVQPSDEGAVSSAELADSLRSFALVGVLMAGVLAATNVATQFQGGSAALTYLSHPHRGRVSAAQALTYGGLGFVFAAVAAAVVLAVGAAVVGSDQFDASYSALDVARMIGGTATGGAVIGAAGVFIGTVVRNPTVASSALPAWYFAELILVPASVQTYLPFGLVDSLIGGTDHVPDGGAFGLVLVYLAAFTWFIRQWALPRDLT
jgi:hypothetical protein